MRKITWYLNRFKAMNIEEVCWRIQQKNMHKREKKIFYEKNLAVFDIPLFDELKNLFPKVSQMSINWENKNYTLFKGQNLFNVFSYEEYKKKWNSGFQTDNIWPINQYSHDILISQREDIGDIRTNWELNRHYQFSGLAKTFYITGNKSILNELIELFYDWNNKNNFLHGVEWTSAMEIAIRVNSWIYMYCFLEKALKKYNLKNDKVLRDISHGIIVMTDYIIKHRARYSSANNHLIIEMYAVGMSGIFFDYKPWKELSFNLLTAELPKQNFSDGVNKEMSLHYQSFIMEAYGLLILEMMHNNIKIPKIWIEYLSKMSEFLCDCCGNFGETIVFGDSDEGKILDLSGESFNYYYYILDLMSMILSKRYTKLNKIHENLYWIMKERFLENSKNKEEYTKLDVKSYKKGGYTFLHSKDKDIFIGIDHADLGYGPLAAHGHADALSFQMYLMGEPVFVDAGTFNYHIDSELRNKFRSTSYHNTLQIGNLEQAEILGPFLWGKRCKCKLEKCIDNFNKKEFIGIVEYLGIKHKRKIQFNETSEIIIIDSVNSDNKEIKKQIFLINPQFQIEKIGERSICIHTNIRKVYLENISNADMILDEYQYSSEYNHKEKGKRIIFNSFFNEIKTNIKIEKKKEI